MNLFQKAKEKAKNFIDSIKKDVKKTKSSFVKDFKRKYADTKTKKSLEAGSLIAFTYNAIHKDKTWDKKPFVVSLGQSKSNKKHILGLNIHWIKDEKKRILLASLIVEMLDKNNGKLVYEDIKPLIKQFEGSPVLRQYAVRRISQKIIKMPTDVYLRAATFTEGDFSS